MTSHKPNLTDLLITHELALRPRRTMSYEILTNELIRLSDEIGKKPAAVFRTVAEYALRLCRAQSAGISVLEQNGDTSHFRWRAIAGLFAANVDKTMVMHSPCGMVVETNKPHLFRRPETFFDYAVNVDPPMEEALLVPFTVDDVPCGTVWAISHSREFQFDATDLTILTDLSQFASSGYRVLGL